MVSRLCLSLLLLAGLAACDRPQAPPPASATSVMGAAPALTPQAAAERTDSQIVAQVKSQLAADPDLGAIMIDVDSKEGLVVLGGVAPNPAAKQRASEIARHTPDVRDVSNQLALKHG